MTDKTITRISYWSVKSKGEDEYFCLPNYSETPQENLKQADVKRIVEEQGNEVEDIFLHEYENSDLCVEYHTILSDATLLVDLFEEKTLAQWLTDEIVNNRNGERLFRKIDSIVNVAILLRDRIEEYIDSLHTVDDIFRDFFESKETDSGLKRYNKFLRDGVVSEEERKAS